jgi:hypothetical protein
VDIPWGSQHGPGGCGDLSMHSSNRLVGPMTTLGLMLRIVGRGAGECGVAVGVDVDVHGAEAERLRLSCSRCSACGAKWSQVTAIADVRRYVSWKHTGKWMGRERKQWKLALWFCSILRLYKPRGEIMKQEILLCWVQSASSD